MKRCIPVVLLSLVLTAVAQQPKRPPAANARIAGIVVDGSDRPVAGATVVMLQGEETLSVPTDGQGRFSIAVRHGTVRLVTRKRGYVVNLDGTLISVSPGQQLRGVTLRMPLAASISGTVLDARRKPVQYARVALVRHVYDERGARVVRPISNVQPAITGDRGEFQISGAEPGDYLLQIEPPMFGQREAGEPFVTAYFPDTPNVSRAQPLQLKSGEETRLDDFTLPSVRGGTIRIRLVNQSDERITNQMAKFVRWGSIGGDAQSAVIPLLFMGGAELIQIPAAPGVYSVTAGWVRSANDSAAPPFALGQKQVEVNRGPVEIEIVAQKGFRLTGRVVQQTGRTATKALPGVRCEVRSDQWPAASLLSAADGAVMIEGLQPGLYHVYCPTLPGDAYLAGITQGERDALKEGLDIRGDTSFTIQLATDGGTVEGSVTDPAQQKNGDVPVVLVPADASLRGRSDLFRLVKTDQLGHFTFRGVAPGAYRVFSWPALEGSAYRNEVFLQKYEDQGSPVTVVPGGKASAAARLLPL
jgi:hypothetical protein